MNCFVQGNVVVKPDLAIQINRISFRIVIASSGPSVFFQPINNFYLSLQVTSKQCVGNLANHPTLCSHKA